MHTIRGEGGGKEGLKSKRDLIQRQKRPDKEAKETLYRGKRDLIKRQNRPF